MKRNHTMMQFFEWNIESDGTHWNRLKELAPELKKRGIDSVWIPPITKGTSNSDRGYGVYDHYDLGEFKQKGSVRTKYGTKQQLQDAIKACHNNGLVVYIDLVMNHKAGADETEVFQVVEVDREDRMKVISEPFDIKGWTKFTFPGRAGNYSDFKWNFEHFNGTDFDAESNHSGIFQIVGENKAWNDKVDDTFGNYDYLMFANIDYNNSEVKQEMITWGKWLADTTHCNGFRLDAIKHIDHDFIRNFVAEVKSERGAEFFIVGEYWNADPSACEDYLAIVDHQLSLFDVPLHYQLHAASQAGIEFDMQTIFEYALVSTHPLNAVTFVDNHDSQPNEALESWIDDWFKQIAYALILLREGGYPCVFYGDYYQIGGEEVIDGKKEAIDPLLYARYHKAYGEQEDYIDHPNFIGWVRRGVEEIERSGCAVVISNHEAGDKRMFVGEHRSGEVWTDLTNTRDEQITIEEDGFAIFPVNGGSVSVWALPEFDL